MEAVCAVCGNEIDAGVGACPYCGAERAITAAPGGGPAHREVNLERGLPPVALALDRSTSTDGAATSVRRRSADACRSMRP